MNERIRKLSEQADDYADATLSPGEFHPDWHDVRDEKFAELILQECIDLISPYTIKGVEMIDPGTHLHPIYVIRKHFDMEMK